MHLRKQTNKYINLKKSFADNNIKPEHRVGGGIFTTLSANRYSAYQSTKMSAHIDSGDTDAGLTSMCVLGEGDYEGAYKRRIITINI